MKMMVRFFCRPRSSLFETHVRIDADVWDEDSQYVEMLAQEVSQSFEREDYSSILSAT